LRKKLKDGKQGKREDEKTFNIQHSTPNAEGESMIRLRCTPAR